ncbi:hypothetical protein FPY71_11555 [Aureimonas fodinaquatilis]|uniref:Uncharacterized protein n=1 Tax=Aureimonas fodinaquatilis TaxID=2565783 RepID=A0A5B0DWE4_9HYPH|nr:hypothetical protein [Aureimonas fodinaquatilis]KAA0971074.1 hypothetical protein FPY71_11555 [Aureimonas fodinaquatilis]
MPIFEIYAPDGKIVRLDEPDEATAIAKFKQDSAQRVNPQSRQPQYDGFANLGAGMTEGMSHVFGAPIGASRWMEETVGSLHPAFDPDNTAANTTGERALRYAGNAIGATLATLPLTRSVQLLARVGIPAMTFLSRFAGQTNSVGGATAEMFAAGVGGATSAWTQEQVPDKYKPTAGLAGELGGSLFGTALTAVPKLAWAGVRTSGQLIGDFIAPLTQTGKERIAGEKLIKWADDPELFREQASNQVIELVPGSKPTLGQHTGDAGITRLEHKLHGQQPSAFEQRILDQNAARRSALANIAPHGSADSVSMLLREQLAGIDNEIASVVTDARKLSDATVDQLGYPSSPTEAGGIMRAELEARRIAAMKKEADLWNAVDPDGNLAMQPQTTVSAVANIHRDIPKSAKLPMGEEAGIYNTVTQYKNIIPFREISVLRSRVSRAMTEEYNLRGKSEEWHRLSSIRNSIDEDVGNVVNFGILQDSKAVGSGVLAEKDAFSSRVLGVLEEWDVERGSRAIGQDTGSYIVGARAQGTNAVSGLYGAVRPPARGSATSEGVPGLPGDSRGGQIAPLSSPLDEAARGRVIQAQNASRNLAATFDESRFGPMLERASYTAPYKTEAASFAASVFAPGPEGRAIIADFQKAGGTEAAMKALEGYAVNSLRKFAMKADGSIDAEKLLKWRSHYDSALQGLPDLNQRVLSAEDAARAMEKAMGDRANAVADRQIGALGTLLKMEDPATIRNYLGRLYETPGGYDELLTVRHALGDDQKALEGMRRATADYFSSRILSDVAGNAKAKDLLKGDEVRSYVQKNEKALRLVLSKEEFDTMLAVATDAGRSYGPESILQKVVGGQGVWQRLKEPLGAGVGGTVGNVVAGDYGSIAGAAGVSSLQIFLGALRQNGIESAEDLLRDAVLNPQRAAFLITKIPANKPHVENKMWEDLAARYVRSATISSLLPIESEQ